MKNFFEIKDVNFSSSKNHNLSNVNFQISKRGDTICLLGPSGVGKTTILRTIAGLEKIHSGEIWLENKLISSKSFHENPENRHIALSFQDNCLFPHLSVKDNVELGLKVNSKRKKIDKKKS